MTNNDMDTLYRLRARLESVFTRRRCDMSLHAVSAFAANNGFAIVESTELRFKAVRRFGSGGLVLDRRAWKDGGVNISHYLVDQGDLSN